MMLPDRLVQLQTCIRAGQVSVQQALHAQLQRAQVLRAQTAWPCPWCRVLRGLWRA